MEEQEAQRRIQRWVQKGYVNIPLNLSNLQIQELPPLPKNLKYLKCDNTTLTHLSNLPDGLERFYCSKTFLKNFIGLPETVNYVKANWCEYIESFDGLPNGVTYFFTFGSNKMNKITYLPQSLRILRIEWYNKITEIEYFPEFIKKVILYEVGSLKKIPNQLHNLEYLDIHLSGIEELPIFPESLKTLYIFASHLRKFPELSQGLQDVSILCTCILNKVLKDYIRPTHISNFICDEYDEYRNF